MMTVNTAMRAIARRARTIWNDGPVPYWADYLHDTDRRT
ncbi:hypothetical protein RGUI_1366 [Rhodovulum sp. P5]|nr:hypothetical protein RGUI_1366 [Rhodovulum sp. P5]